MHAGKTAECELWLPNGRVDVAIINLGHFVAVAITGIFTVNVTFAVSPTAIVLDSRAPLLKSNFV